MRCEITLAFPGADHYCLASHVYGVLAQLVERLNGIEEVRGSNPLGSTSGAGDENLGSTAARESASPFSAERIWQSPHGGIIP